MRDIGDRMPQTTENPNQPLVLDPKNDDSLTAADIVASPQLLEPLIDILEGPDRRARQLSAKLIKEVATLNGELLIPVIKRVIGALHRPEAQTRWEILEALIVLMDLDYKVCARAFDGAEAGLYDEGSKTLRSASFAFFAHLGAKSPAWRSAVGRIWTRQFSVIMAIRSLALCSKRLRFLLQASSSERLRKT